MAARVLQRRAGIVSFAAAAATVAMASALTQPTVHAEAHQDLSASKPIYDDAPVRAIEELAARRPRRPTPTDRLAVHVGRARLALYRQALAAEQQVDRAVASAFAVEDAVARTLAALAPARDTGERLLPGAVYVLVAAMAGTILTRGRGRLLRTVGPPALGVAAASVLLPVTSGNVADLVWRYEQRAPAVARAHVQVRDAVIDGWQFVSTHGRAGVRAVDEAVTSVRQAWEDWTRKGK